MVLSLRKLVDFLLEEIALCGDRGASPFDISHLIDDFHSSTKPLPATPIRRADARPGLPVQQASVDEKFKEAAWRWLTVHPEVSVGKACEGNTLTLSQAKATYNERPGMDRSGDASDGSDIDTVNVEPGDGSVTENGIRVFVSEERMWLSIAGHAPDHTRIPAMHFALLSLIASRKGSGIVQSELTTLSGQDKRSVPKRTDMLTEKGYVEKRQVQYKALRTSLLVLRKFARESDKGEQREDMIDFDAFLKKLFQVLKERYVISRDDLKGNLSMKDPYFRKIFSRALRKLDRIGCLRRVRALTQYADVMKKRHPSVMFIREPTDEDRRLFFEDSRSLCEHLQQNDAEEEGDVEDDEQENSELVTEKGGRVLPIWTPDRTIPNIVFDLVNNAGTNGITNLELVMRCFGTFYRRPLFDLVTRLVDAWPLSQPLHLRHFSIVRDVSLEGTVSHFVHYTLQNFLCLAEFGSVSLESIEIKSRDEKKVLPSIDARPHVDQYGFLISDKPLPPVSSGGTSLQVRTKEPATREQASDIKPLGSQESAAKPTQHRALSVSSIFFLRRKIVMDILDQSGGLYPLSSIWYPFTTAWIKGNNRTEHPDMRTIKAAVKGLVDGGKLQRLTFSSRNSKGNVITQTILAKAGIQATDKPVLDMQQAILNADANLFFAPGPEIDPSLRKSRNYFPVGPHSRIPELSENVTVTLQNEPAVVRLARAKRQLRESRPGKRQVRVPVPAASARNAQQQRVNQAFSGLHDTNPLGQTQQWHSFPQPTLASFTPYALQPNPAVSTAERVAEMKSTSKKTRRKRRLPTEIDSANNKRRRLARFDGKEKDKSLASLNTTRNKRQRHNELTPDIISLIPVSIAVIKALAGGSDGKVMNWHLLQYAFPDFDQEDLIPRGKYEQSRCRLQISKMQSDFQEHFLQAYAANQIPPIKYDRLEEFDWSWLVRWAANELDTTALNSVPNLPNNWEQFNSVFEIRPEPPSQIDEFFHASSQITIPRKRHLISALPFSVPLKRRAREDSRQANRYSDLESARTWIRANVAAPQEAYNPQEAGTTLKHLGERLISEAKQSLVTSCVIIAHNRGRTVPGRNYDFTELFVTNLGRKRAINSNDMKRASHFKLNHLDEEFRLTGHSSVKYDAEDGDLLCIINLFADGQITVRPVEPPKDKYGLTEGGYLTQFMDKQKLRFDVEIRPVSEKYVYGNPLFFSPTPDIPRGDLPDNFPESFAPTSGSGSFCCIPLWLDIHGKVIRVLWELCIAATLGIVALRPGINAAAVSQMLQPCLATWEIVLLAQYLVSLEAIDCREGGQLSSTTPLSVKRWWWLAIPSGDGNDTVPTDR